MGDRQPQAALNGNFFLNGNGGQSSFVFNWTDVSPAHQLTEPGTTCISVFLVAVRVLPLHKFVVQVIKLLTGS